MTATLLDAALALLLVSASAVVLTTADRSPERERTAAPTLTTLTTVTETVRSDGRVRHGTLAELLGVAARTDGFTTRVRRAVRGVVGSGVRVVARWRVDGAVRGRVAVGPRPPDGAVQAARVVLPRESGRVTVTVRRWSP